MIPTGPEHINRKARVLEDVIARNDGRVIYRAGETARVMDVRPLTTYRDDMRSPGFARVVVRDLEGDRRPYPTNANNLELLPTEAELFNALTSLGLPSDRQGVSVTVSGGGEGGGFSSWRTIGTTAEGAAFASSAPAARKVVAPDNGAAAERVKAKDLEHAHTRLAAAYREVKLAQDALKRVQDRPF